MLVITAGTSDYLNIIKAQAKKCAEFDYRHVIYDLGGLGMGIPHIVEKEDLTPQHWGHSLCPCKFKTDLMLKALMIDDDIICWLDGDCLPVRPFLPDGEWDAAVTLRPAGEVEKVGIHSMNYLNAGVIWIRRLQFAIDWRNATYHLNTDQDGMNVVVGNLFGKREWIESVGKTITNKSGFRIKVLDGMKWNRWVLPPDDKTRILHFKRRIRGKAARYLDV